MDLSNLIPYIPVTAVLILGFALIAYLNYKTKTR